MIGDPSRKRVRVFLGEAHVALLIYGVVVALIGNRRDGDGRFVEFGEFEDGVQAHRPSGAPTPGADALGIEVRALAEHFANGGGLLFRCKDPDLAESGLAPGSAPRRFRAPVVDAHDDIPPLRQHGMPDALVVIIVPFVADELARGFNRKRR